MACKSTGSKVLFVLNEKDGTRLSHCGLVPYTRFVSLVGNAATGKAGFVGLKSCGSVWWCPLCSPRICAARREELSDLLGKARAAGLAPSMLTLTFRHRSGDDLTEILSSLKMAWKRFRDRREWRALPVVGLVTALEVTHGRNGWHPHQHSLVLMEGDGAAAVAKLEALRSVWLTCLAAFGLTGNDAALHVQGASAAGEYFAKFGAAEELTLGHEKSGRREGLTPWQLLEAARDGDAKSARLWGVYAVALKGRRQLVWSKGLKARFGIGEKDDAEIAAAEPAEPLPVLRTWLGVGSWRQARRRRCALIEAVLSGTSLDAAEFGATDSERWRRDGGGFDLLE